jgi:hypothetical protein
MHQTSKNADLPGRKQTDIPYAIRHSRDSHQEDAKIKFDAFVHLGQSWKILGRPFPTPVFYAATLTPRRVFAIQTSPLSLS